MTWVQISTRLSWRKCKGFNVVFLFCSVFLPKSTAETRLASALGLCAPLRWPTQPGESDTFTLAVGQRLA